MFSLEHLTSFVAVAEELHFGRAAARLTMTQPPLSRRIQALEHEVGVELLERSRRTVRLTPAGRVFLADARRILELSEQAALSARRVPGGEVGTVTLGFTAATAYSYLETVLAAVRDRLPHVDLVLREMVSSAQRAALLAGDLDLGLVRPPMGGPGLATAPLAREPLVAALPADHRLARRGTDPDVRDFDGEPFVMYSPAEARYFYEVLSRAFRDARVTPRYVQHLAQVHTILTLVRSGHGVSLVPAAATRLGLTGVVLRPVTGVGEEPVELEMAWRATNDNPALAALVDLLRSAAAAG
ncbi:LysR family transcriptional regulator [Streptomyces sp. NPDC059740]|uniref:LysR family transcriptional regulator n=1 Tax=Streptomyces sp. NPDC059740 TaxID=3346926 RepID=UPI00365478BB